MIERYIEIYSSFEINRNLHSQICNLYHYCDSEKHVHALKRMWLFEWIMYHSVDTD